MHGVKTRVMDDIFTTMQQVIPYRFGQVKLLELALTHSSWANEQGCPQENNERLEFLGDAVLELCITEEAYNRYPDADEGLLTRLRSRLVKAPTLAELARGLGLDKYLRLGRGEESQGGRDREGLLADALEALFGAVFQDGGYLAARAMLLQLFEPLWPETLAPQRAKDHKSHLQELTQEQHRDRPVYTLVDSSGPDHEKRFEVEVRLPDGQSFRAVSTSLKKAEQCAASRAVASLRAPK
jgi:ribonuclease-3